MRKSSGIKENNAGREMGGNEWGVSRTKQEKGPLVHTHIQQFLNLVPLGWVR